jgi:hypothetical protein
MQRKHYSRQAITMVADVQRTLLIASDEILYPSFCMCACSLLEAREDIEREREKHCQKISSFFLLQ